MWRAIGSPKSFVTASVVILGAPNAGKSSLFNALARREAAIVTDEPGTTRDLLEIVLDLKGARVRVTDTAGLRHDAGKVEAIGIERARAKAHGADLVAVAGGHASAGAGGRPDRRRAGGSDRLEVRSGRGWRVRGRQV